MLKSVEMCESVADLNQAQRDLVNQFFKRSITQEEFVVGYDSLRSHSEFVGMKFYTEYRTYGPSRINAQFMMLLQSIKGARFINQFNQWVIKLTQYRDDQQLDIRQFDMAWTLLLAQADFQGYSWNKFQGKFYES